MPFRVLSLLVALFVGLGGHSDSKTASIISGQSAPSPVIVIGFVGGFISHNNLVHGEVQLAQRIRQDYPSGVYVKVFENHRGEDAYWDVLRVLDAQHRGIPAPEEKRNAHIIIYGHSWGGSETVALARRLQRDGIPVLLTVQMDSVGKFGENDSLIPDNVVEAANFYQTDGLLHGRSEIHAADPTRTQIIGNFKFNYSSHAVPCSGYSWYARTFEKPHISIECDPNVLNRVESLIRSKLPRQDPAQP